MTSQPDKLFRDKLENFQRPAPTAAWDKIESNLSKSNRVVAWIRVAASIVLLVTAAILVWPKEKEVQVISKTSDQKAVQKSDSITKPVIKEEVPEQKVIDQSKQKNFTARVHQSEKPVKKDIQVDNKSIVPEINQPESPEPLIAEVTPTQEASTTIVYTAQEVNSKFLKKKLPPEATPENKDASGIQKLIGLAYAAKNSEAGLGDLRQKKDDLFALGLNKKKGEN